MSLIGALNVGRSALTAQQAAIQITGNNIANAGNADYTRQTTSLTPARDQQYKPGVFIGSGVELSAVQRQIDEALQSRLRGSVSDDQSAQTAQQWIGRVESVFNELGDDDLSTRLSTFFTSWSNLANQPQDISLRQVVLQNGDSVAKWFNGLSTQLNDLDADVANRLKSLTTDADNLAKQVADLNSQVVVAEGGGSGQANGLRDQRDAVLAKLSELTNIRTVQQDNGVVNVYLGSEPLVIGADSRGVAVKTETVDGRVEVSAVIKQTGAAINAAGGQLGGLQQAHSQIAATYDKVDDLASNLIFELNKLHAGGQGLTGLSQATAANAVDDTTAALNSDAAGLRFKPQNGSFVVHVKQKATGLVTSTLVQVDLDGRGTETSLDSLRSDLDAVADVKATTVGGKLQIAAESDAVEISFSQDSSGALAALGINSFYTGRGARDIAVADDLRGQPALLAAAKNGEKTDNQTARAIAGLESQSLAGLKGVSLKDAYQAAVNGVASDVSAAKTNADAAKQVKETLEAQREALSGVSLDEEAVNLIRQQRAFQGAARLISAVDELMKTVIGLV